MDSDLEKSIESYNYAEIALRRTKGQLDVNTYELGVARRNLRLARERWNARLVALYQSDGEDSFLEILLGAYDAVLVGGAAGHPGESKSYISVSSDLMSVVNINEEFMSHEQTET